MHQESNTGPPGTTNMISLTSGNLLRAPVDALVNTVNTEGVMGKGIAYQFKVAHPKMFEDYSRACKAGVVELGKMHVYDLGGLVSGPKYIINFPTKGHWRSNSKIADIAQGLQDLVRVVRALKINSIAIPPLGCGNGGLDWGDVLPLIQRAFADVRDVEVYIFEPKGAPAAKDIQRTSRKPSMTGSRAVLISLMDRYVKGLLEPFVTLLEVHKLMYFMQEAGEQLKLEYSQGTYGPYAANLKHQLSRLEGHYIVGFGDATEKPGKTLELLDGAIEEAESYLLPREDSAKRMDRVTKLIEGFEDSYGLELLATVHWVMVRDPIARGNLDAAIAGVHQWSARKRAQMSADQIEAAWNQLCAGDWHFVSSSMDVRQK